MLGLPRIGDFLSSLFTALSKSRLTIVAPYPLTDCAIRSTMFAMKQCPECSAQYDDNLNFCTKDGRSLHEVSAVSSRLCPHCANSIAEDSAHCPYCKAEVDTAPSPEWLIRDERPREMKPSRREKTTMPKIMLIAGIVLCVIAVALLGTGILGRVESGDTLRLLAEK